MNSKTLESNLIESESPGLSESLSDYQARSDFAQISPGVLLTSSRTVTSNVAQAVSFFIVTKQVPQIIFPQKTPGSNGLEKEFNDRAERWRRETSLQSSLSAKFMHEDYQAIMVMGTPAIPLILNRLKKAPEHWFWALKFLAKHDFAKGTSSPSAAAKAWLKWGRDNGYIS